jgi:hypothetical protein
MPSPSRTPSNAASFALALLLAACATNERQVSREYAGRDLEGKVMAVILPDSSRVEPANPKQVLAAFPRAGDVPASAVLAREFDDYFYSELERYLDFVRPVRVPDTVPAPPADRSIAFARKASLDMPGFTFAIPTRDFLRAHGVESDLVLLVSRLESSQGKADIVAPKFGGSIQENFLLLEGWYVIWDYERNRPVANGRFRPNQVYKYELGADDWMKSFDQVVKMVMEASPFRGAEWYRR